MLIFLKNILVFAIILLKIKIYSMLNKFENNIENINNDSI